jgi:hypothetical protein
MAIPLLAAKGDRPAPQQVEAVRDVYYPGTEKLGPGEMLVVALGTGMPTGTFYQ